MHVGLVAHWQGTVFTVERDPSIPLRDFMTELYTPTACWRLYATDARGHKESLLDTLLAGPRVLAADASGLVVGDEGRAHLRGRDGWRVVEGVAWMGGPCVSANTFVTPESVVFAWNDIGRTILRVLDRTTGAIERVPDLPKTRAIAVVGKRVAWTGDGFVALRDTFEDEEPSLVVLPSSASYLTSQDDALVAVLDRGLAIVRGDDAELHHLEHRFVQAWTRPRSGAWLAMLGGSATLGGHGGQTKRVGACLCRLRAGAVEAIWAETPPPIGQHFTIGGLDSLAFGDDRIYLAHGGELVAIDPEGPLVQPVTVE